MDKQKNHAFGPVYCGGPGYEHMPKRCVRCGDPVPEPWAPDEYPEQLQVLQCDTCGGILCPACEDTAPEAVLDQLRLSR